MKCSPVSPPRSRKVAVASTSEHSGSQEVSSSLGQDAGKGRIVSFKNFDIAFNDGTEIGDGRMHFCYENTCHHNSNNSCENMEDYFLPMEDECTLEHNCLGRVKCVTLDMFEHLGISGRSLDHGHLLAKAGDGCVVKTRFTEVDLDKKKYQA